MTVPPELVVDASVAVKWHLTDESHIREASALLTEYYEGRVDLVAPAQIRYEIANTLSRAYRDGRIGDEKAATEFARFLGYGISDESDADELVIAAQGLALETGASVYDAVYVMYAELHGHGLVTADGRLARQMIDYTVPVHLLSELDLS